MTSLINKLTKLAMIPVIAGSLGSCRDAKNDFCKVGNYNGYKVSIGCYGVNGRFVSIDSGIKDIGFFASKIISTEPTSNCEEKKHFSEIRINTSLPKNHPIMKYAVLDSLEKIYDYVNENGIDCNKVKK